jgi:xanthine dehydrogenase accessory factor
VIESGLTRRAQQLARQGFPFVSATVVRAAAPTSVQPGSAALVHADGKIEGFVGGVCAEHSVRLYALQAIESGEPLLLRILPDGPGGGDPTAPAEIERDQGSVTVRNPCLSGGAIEIFLEPALPPPRVLAVGTSPIVGALAALAPPLGLEVVAVAPDGSEPAVGALALVVAAHGHDEVPVLAAALQAGVPYVGLVASRIRGAAVLEELRAGGVEEKLIAQVETPAGIDIGARSAGEIALSILARIVEVRRSGRAPASLSVAATALDPICGMTVVVAPETPSLEHDGATVYFCCEGCRRAFGERLAAEQAP